MINRYKHSLLAAPVILLLALSPGLAAPGKVTVKSASHVSLKASDLASRLNLDLKKDVEARITVYHYTSGPEILSYTGDETVKEESAGGTIKVMVMVLEKTILRKGLFLKARGDSHDILLENLVVKINRILKPYR